MLNYIVDTFATTTITSTLDATAPPSGTGYTATTGTQTNRVSRDGQGNSCGFAEGFPGSVTVANPLRYDAFTFTPANTGCTTVTYATTTTPATNQIFSVAYGSGGFVPTNIATNYLADSGSSPATINIPISYAFSSTAGQSFTVVVHELTSGAAAAGYTLTVSGAPTTVCNALPPTAADADVRGKVTSATGRGVANARVTLTDSQGSQRTAITIPFGYFRFNEVAAGATFVVSVSAQIYQFNSQVITVNSDVTDLNITALP